MLKHSRTRIRGNRVGKLCNGPQHPRSAFQGLRGILLSCVMKDSGGYCFLDRCSSLRGRLGLTSKCQISAALLIQLCTLTDLTPKCLLMCPQDQHVWGWLCFCSTVISLMNPNVEVAGEKGSGDSQFWSFITHRLIRDPLKIIHHGW